MAEKVEIVDLTINVDRVNQDTRALQIQLQQLKEAAQRVKAEQGELSDEYIEYTAAIKATQKELRTQQNLTTNLIAANEAQTGSIDQLRKQLSVVSVQWARLSKEERQNTEEGKRLTRQKLELTEALKSEERATGDARRNVGNYAEAIQNLQPGLSGAIQGFGGLTKASLAFIATPIGAVIAAIVAIFKLLQGAFKRSLSSQEKMNKITGKLSAAFGVLLDFLEPVVDFILDVFIAALETLGGWLDTVIGKLEEWGIISEETAEKVRKPFDEAADAADRLADAERRLTIAEIELQKTQLRSQTQAEKLRQIRDDETRSIEERIEANEKLGRVLQNQAAAELKIAQSTLQIAIDRQKVNGESLESIQEIGQAEIKLLEIRERITSQQSEQLANLNSLRKEISDANIKRQNEEEKARQEAQKRELEDLMEFAATNEEVAEDIDAINEQVREEAQRQREQAAEQRQIEFDAELAAAQDNAFRRLELERQALEQKREQEIAFAQSIGANTTAIEEKFSKAREAINKAEQDTKFALAAGFFGNLATLAGEGTAIAKAAGVAETTINTFKAAQAAYSSLAGIPVIGPGLGIAAAGAAVASGIANVKKILSVDSGLPGDSSVSASVPSQGSQTTQRPGAIAPNINQGIVSREALQNLTQNNINVQPTLVIDDVTNAQNSEDANQTTSVI